MDKLIKKVDKDVKHNNKKMAEKDIKVLLKKDKIQDKKVEKYDKMKKC